MQLKPALSQNFFMSKVTFFKLLFNATIYNYDINSAPVCTGNTKYLNSLQISLHTSNFFILAGFIS